MAACTALAQQPRIDSITPSQGPIAGGTVITVRGTNLSATTVKLDRDATEAISKNDSEILIRMPRHDSGYVVITARSASGTAYGEYLYVPPRLDEIQPGYITTVAGVGRYARSFGRATEAMVYPNGFAFDASGATYIADANANRVYRVSAAGTIETFAGSGSNTGLPTRTGDGGIAIEAEISFPHNLAFDTNGNAYVPDGHNRIRKVDRNGIISTSAGTGERGFSGDGGPAVQAQINNPSFVAADGDDIFFIDSGALRIRRIHLADGTISTFAGNGTNGFSGDGGPATDASFSLAGPDDGGLAIDGAGNVYLLDTRNGRIRRIDRKSGVINTVLIVRNSLGEPVNNPTAFAIDRDGNIYYTYGGFIAKATAGGASLSEYGSRDLNRRGFSADGTLATEALYPLISALGIDGSGNIVFADSTAGRARRINIASGRLETIAGMGPRIFAENGPAIAAVLGTNDGGDLDFSSAGDLLIADTWNYRIRRLDSRGNLTTIAGNGTVDGPFADGDTLRTGLVPLAIHADATGIDVVPFDRVARIDSEGVIHLVTSANVTCALSGDGGQAQLARVCQPWDTARDRQGNLLIADTNNNRIRRVNSLTGIITTIAGNGGPVNGFERYGQGAFCGDGGPALDACLNTPYGLAVDADGSVYISEIYSGRIRKIDPQGAITTYATNFPVTKIRMDPSGSIFGVSIDRVLRIDRFGTITTIAGVPGAGFGGDGGLALAARFDSSNSQSSGLAIDKDGNLFFIDPGNYRVRAVRYGAVLPPPNVSINLTATGSTLRATVFTANGTPAPSVRVDFTTPATGATCTPSNSFAITDANGVASVTCSANCLGGTYSVVAHPLTASSFANVSLTNVAGPCRRRSARH